jgi:hypothetical protein
MMSLSEAFLWDREPRREAMKAPDDVSAMLKLKELGWGGSGLRRNLAARNTR